MSDAQTNALARLSRSPVAFLATISFINWIGYAAWAALFNNFAKEAAGFPGLELSIWHGLWAPKGTPADIIAKLNGAAVETLNDPAVRKRMEELGQDIPTAEEMKPASFAAFHRAEFARWKTILDAAGVKVE